MNIKDTILDWSIQESMILAGSHIWQI